MEKEVLIIYSFYNLSSQILEAKGDDRKLELCRTQLSLLKSFIDSSLKRDGELPPIIPCCDMMPEILMRYGKWNEAEEVIEHCIKCNAYGHVEYKSNRDHVGFWVVESGSEELERLKFKKAASIAALEFIKDNPGTLQNKIYKEKLLADFDHESLVWFCRNSHQIRKEKDGKTNRLYAID